MRTLILFVTFLRACTVEGLVANWTQLPYPTPRSVEEVYGNVLRSPTLDPPIMDEREFDDDYVGVRTGNNCTFPIDLVIIQDATASFENHFKEIRARQLKLIVDELNRSHPGSRLGVVSFRDKPIWPHGDATDFCSFENLPLQPMNSSVLNDTYAALESYGGADLAENQLEAMIATAQSKTIGWGKNSLASSLMVVATDSWFHYDGDGLNAHGLPPFTGDVDFANHTQQCVSEYYPSPLQTTAALTSIEAYAGFLLFDPHWAGDRPHASWEWLNKFLGQSDDFIVYASPDSKDFWYDLSKIISAMELDECIYPKITSNYTITTDAASTSFLDSSSQTTSNPSVTTPIAASSTPHTNLSTGRSVTCISDDCPCSELLKELRRRPDQMTSNV